MSSGPTTNCRGQTGMSLVEVLVTLVATSVGLLGVAALQLVTVRSNQEAYARLQASMLASSLLESMRANSPGFRNGDYSNIDFDSIGPANTRAGSDLGAWQAQIDRVLPGGGDVAGGAVSQAPGTNVVTITIRWGVQSGAVRGGAPNTLSVRSEI